MSSLTVAQPREGVDFAFQLQLHTSYSSIHRHLCIRTAQTNPATAAGAESLRLALELVWVLHNFLSSNAKADALACLCSTGLHFSRACATPVINSGCFCLARRFSARSRIGARTRIAMERDNWIKFVDRIGDTYRWMGEDVSAGEVRGFLSELAGTALIVLDPASHKGNGLNETAFMARLLSELRAKGVSKYAVPRLVMVQEDLVDAGVTFKQAKNVVKNID
ncbi:hypothetical protein AYO22_03482 [Fonsecaea multimorphosa]|nr:hypothetical protein AYO22_03482 [Fonsecaea multimorphosa]